MGGPLGGGPREMGPSGRLLLSGGPASLPSGGGLRAPLSSMGGPREEGPGGGGPRDPNRESLGGPREETGGSRALGPLDIPKRFQILGIANIRHRQTGGIDDGKVNSMDFQQVST